MRPSLGLGSKAVLQGERPFVVRLVDAKVSKPSAKIASGEQIPQKGNGKGLRKWGGRMVQLAICQARTG